MVLSVQRSSVIAHFTSSNQESAALTPGELTPTHSLLLIEATPSVLLGVSVRPAILDGPRGSDGRRHAELSGMGPQTGHEQFGHQSDWLFT